MSTHASSSHHGHLHHSSSSSQQQQQQQQNQQQQHGPPPAVASATPSTLNDLLPSATPTLKVMRLQAPHLSPAPHGNSPLLSPHHALTSALLLPDSFGVIHVGETFSAYLGVLNTSGEWPVRGLTVGVQLQTPSRRIVLPSSFLGGGGHDEDLLRQTPHPQPHNQSSQDVPPQRGVDAIVSHRLEEAGQHILRVEVGYVSNGAKTLRKFYRFNVTVPLHVAESVVRSGDDACVVSVGVENTMERGAGGGGGAVTVEEVAFRPAEGLIARRIGGEVEEEETENDGGGTSDDDNHNNSHNHNHNINNHKNKKSNTPRRSALDLYDSSGRLEPGDSHRYLFSVKAHSAAASLRGIAYGDELGQAVITYRKAMGESGTLYSSTVVCPPTSYRPIEGPTAATTTTNTTTSTSDISSSNTATPSKFLIHKSGLSVDVAAASAQRSSLPNTSTTTAPRTLDELLPVTIEPIDPPATLLLSHPRKLTVLVVNHSDRAMNLQLQMRLSHMTGVVVCGSSFLTLGEVPPRGGSCAVEVRLVALVAGLFEVKGFYVVDLTTGREVGMPSLFEVFVELPEEMEKGVGGEGVAVEEKKVEDVVAF